MTRLWSMRAWHYATVLGGAFVTVAPQFVQALPAEWRDMATAIIAMLVAVAHLLMPSPTQK